MRARVTIPVVVEFDVEGDNSHEARINAKDLIRNWRIQEGVGYYGQAELSFHTPGAQVNLDFADNFRVLEVELDEDEDIDD